MKNSVLRRLVAIGSLLLGVPAFAQTLTWDAPRQHFFTDVGGSSSRNSVAATAFQNGIWIAYTSKNNCQNNNGLIDCPIIISNNSGSGSSDAFNGGTTIPSSFFFVGYLISSENPALTSGIVNGVETLFLAFRTAEGTEFVAKTTDGSNWSLTELVIPNGAVYSPSMALSPDGNTLYIGYMDATQNFNQTLCSTSAANPSSNPNCWNFSANGFKKVNFNPSLAFFQNQLYMGVEDRGDSHCIYFYRGDPSNPSGFQFWNPPNGCPEQTSAAPSLVTHNGYLYTAFRTNDSSQKFTVRVSKNGSDFAYRQQPGFAIDGPPGLVDLNRFGDNRIMAVFSRSNILYVSYGHP